MLSSEEHPNIPNNTVNATCSTTIFLELRSNTTYNITVTAVNKVGCGIGISITVRTSIALQYQLSGIFECKLYNVDTSSSLH